MQQLAQCRVAAEDPERLVEHGAERDQIRRLPLARSTGLHESRVNPGPRVSEALEILDRTICRHEMQPHAVARQYFTVTLSDFRVGAASGTGRDRHISSGQWAQGSEERPQQHNGRDDQHRNADRCSEEMAVELRANGSVLTRLTDP